MKKKRRRFSAEFKLKVILEISKWKSDFLDNAIEHMRSPTERSNEDANEEVQKLYEKIGRLQVENDYLKKRLI